MPGIGTETTTTTNAILNTLELCRMIGSKLRPNDCNISKQHIATLLATEKKVNLKWMKLFHPSLSRFSLPHFYHLSSVIAHGTISRLKQIFSVGPNSRPKAQLFPMGPHGPQTRYFKHKALLRKMWVPGQKCEFFFTLSLMQNSGFLQQVSVNTSTNDLLATKKKFTAYWSVILQITFFFVLDQL